MTDSDSELPLSIAKKYEVPFVPMPYSLEDVEYAYDLGETTDFIGFFRSMREGKMPTTSTYPPQYYVDFCRNTLESGQDILFLSFSSKLSSAYDYLSTAAAQLREEYPQRRIETFDTLSISGSMALLVYHALVMRDEGASMDEVIGWMRENILRANSYFTVDDLNHLKRGGRVSATAAVVGTMLSVKPVLTINREGKARAVDKVMGRKKGDTLSGRDGSGARGEPRAEHMHNSCTPTARTTRWRSRRWWMRSGVHLGNGSADDRPVIGAHAGPIRLGLCFFGRERTTREAIGFVAARLPRRGLYKIWNIHIMDGLHSIRLCLLYVIISAEERKCICPAINAKDARRHRMVHP